MNRILLAAVAAIPLLAEAVITVPTGTTRQVVSEEDMTALNDDGHVVIEQGATLEFNSARLLLQWTTKLEGPGTVLFNLNENYAFNGQWDGSGLTGFVVVSNNSSLGLYSNKCLGKTKVIAYASEHAAAIQFNAGAAGTYENDFELHGDLGAAKWKTCISVGDSDVRMAGKVSLYGENSTAKVTVTSAAGKTMGSVRFAGGYEICGGAVHTFMGATNAAGLPVAVYGDGSLNSIVNLGGGVLASDCSSGVNILAGAVTNGTINVAYGNRWRLAIDDPFRDTAAAKACMKWSAEAGGWVDLYGHHLLIGVINNGNRWDNYWTDLTQPATTVRNGGFCNTAKTLSTLLFRQMFANISNDNPVRLKMEGNLNVEYDGHYAAGPATGYDFNSSWSCWLGNYPNATSSTSGDLIAVRGALHLASSANYPTVSKLVAKTAGAVYVQDGATLNPKVALCVEGDGRIYLQQDITVSYITKDGQVVDKEPGDYTTDDFDFLYSFTGSSSGNPEIGGSRKVTITGSLAPVARVGNVPYVTVDEAVAAAKGAVIDLLGDATYTPVMDFKVRKGAFALASDGTAFSGYTSESTVDGVTTFVYRDSPTFSGGDGDTYIAPYMIATPTDLKELAYWTAAGNTFVGKSFRQTGPIAWNGSVDGAFAGIGTYQSATDRFGGTYDGAGFEISGMLFTDRKYAGLFNQTQGATIKNLSMDGASFVGTASEYGGALFVGNATGGTKLVGLVAKGEFGTTDKPITHSAAGVVYRATATTVLSCTNEASIVCSNSKVAGILGITQNSAEIGLVTLEDCVNAGSIAQKGCTTQDGGVGGIVAYGWHGTAYDDKGTSGIRILNCANTGSVLSDFATCYLGSIVGNAYGDIPIVCSGCVAQANMKSVGNVAHGNGCAGLTGATIDGCVANFLSFEDGVRGDCTCRLMCDSKEDIAFAEKTAKLAFDLALGTTYGGTVSFDGKRVKGVLEDPTHLVFWKGWGLMLLFR